MRLDFRRLAIVNRGEAAMRLVNAVCEYNDENGTDIRTIALYTEPDRAAMFVRDADESLCLGPATLAGPDGRRRQTYLDLLRLETALVEARADAVWVGWGFVAESAEFAELCRRLDIVFVGPYPEVMHRLGDKIASKRLAEAAGVPVVPWSGGPVETVDDALARARRLGYPVLVKASAGGGGRGIRKVRSEDDLPDAFESARAEARHAFGDPTVFLEEAVNAARHIEVQVIADSFETTWAVGVRDCSVQRRNQKVVEESASTALDAATEQEIRSAAVRLCTSVGYTNAGTVEFLYEPERRRFMFMEVNTRLQVEHPVTEMTTGVDLVKLQLHVARGGTLQGRPPQPRGHAVEVRLNAEDAERGFAPTPGRIVFFRQPAGPGIRVETGVGVGDAIAPDFDSMIAKILAWGQTRDEAIARLTRALAQAAVVVEGGTTNKAFLLGLLHRPELRRGDVSTGWLDRLAASGEHLPRQHGEIAVLMAAVEAYNEELAHEQARLHRTASQGRPEAKDETGRTIELRCRGHAYAIRVYRLGPQRYRMHVDGERFDVEVDWLGRFERRLRCGRDSHQVLSVVQGPTHLVEVGGVPHTVTRDDGGWVRSSSPAVVVSILVRTGDEIAAGAPLLVLESMKMETTVVAPFGGRVRSIDVRPNVQVDSGSPLLQLQAIETQSAAAGDRLSFRFETLEAAAAASEKCVAAFRSLRDAMLGYDVDPSDPPAPAAIRAARGLEPNAPALVQLEDDLLELFADLCALSGRTPDPEVDPGLLVASGQHHLFAFLRSLDRAREDVPEAFLDRLQQVLARYGVESLDPSPALDEAAFWLFRAHQRVRAQAPIVVAVLDGRLEAYDKLGPGTDASFRLLLDRLVSVTEGREQMVCDLAREVQFRFFDEPMLEAVRAAVYAEFDHNLAALEADPDSERRPEWIRTLVDCSQPMHLRLVDWAWASTWPRAPYRHDVSAEVLVRRYYRIRRLENVTISRTGEQAIVRAEYDYEGRRIHLFAALAPYTGFRSVLALMRDHVRDVPPGDDVALDVYLVRGGTLPDADESAAEAHAMLQAVDWERPLRRVVVDVTGERGRTATERSCCFTFRRHGGEFREETLYRNLHPLMGKRLNLWRLANFHIERLPSVEDMYLFHGVARDNPKDERLMTLAEVRDLTPVLDEHGRVTALPQLERMLVEALSAIRRVQSHLPPRRRLLWNRVALDVRPLWTVPPEDWRRLAERSAPATHGLGLECVILHVQIPGAGGVPVPKRITVSNPGERGLVIQVEDEPDEPLPSLSRYAQKEGEMRRRGLVYPYAVVELLTPRRRDGVASYFPPGEFVEHDLITPDSDVLVPVDRPYGENNANLVVGLITNFTDKHPEGMTRVAILGDPSRSLGALAEPECRRIIGALDLAERRRIPVEWFALSSGARISMTSGVENMDWIGAVLRRLVEYTQAGGEVNVIVTGINVGAQPYWNAEATMLMHTKGILVMTPDSAMVLTGKQALDFSGGVSAEDNLGIGGYDRIMGPNAEAQYWAGDLESACDLLFRHYEHTYVVPGERFPRRAATRDPIERDVRSFPHAHVEGCDFTTVGDVFSAAHNAERKKPFDIRSVMRSVTDEDHVPVERWLRQVHGETGVVWDAHVGGIPVCLLGIESRGLPRHGFVPADGPEAWTSGTLFPQSSKKIARAINTASGNRPVVVLANLSGFDGSPESMRKLQLEFGAEIGRAVVNFKGPIVFTVISRYHGGAFVVFSKRLNDGMEVAAVEGSYASVIGGAPAAAVVFARDVDARTSSDPRVVEVAEQLQTSDEAAKPALRARLEEVTQAVRSEKLGEIATEFDAVHSVQRAQKVGAVDTIVPAASLRPYLADTLERGMTNVESNLRATVDER